MKKFENYCANLAVLERAHQENLKNEFIVSGIIDKFFVQFELGWKVMKELLKYEGKSAASTGSPREIIKAAYAIYEFMDERVWISMLKNRNDMTHIYDGDAAKKLVRIIIEQYIPEFIQLRNEIKERYQNVLEEI